MASVLPSILAAFRQHHPGVLIEVNTSNAFANLTHRDADVAVRPAVDPPETLVCRRISGIAFANYAAPYHLKERGLDPAGEAVLAQEALDWPRRCACRLELGALDARRPALLSRPGTRQISLDVRRISAPIR